MTGTLKQDQSFQVGQEGGGGCVECEGSGIPGGTRGMDRTLIVVWDWGSVMGDDGMSSLLNLTHMMMIGIPC